MPNWALTDYCFQGTNEQAKDLYDKIDNLQNLGEPFVPSDFGKLWMGCLVNYLGGDWKTVNCRGEIIDYQLHDELHNEDEYRMSFHKFEVVVDNRFK